MDARKVNDALFAKMFAEQQEYRAWLTALPPDEILDHAAEYLVREDILACLEDNDLTQAQALALLERISPLADVYQDWAAVKTNFLDDVRDTLESCANHAVKQARERPSVLDGLKRPAQPGPDKGTVKHSDQER